MGSTRKSQVYSVGNYLMTGKLLGKGHFAKVEEATHRIIGKKVAIKIIDLTCIKEEYARRNLHREPRVMSKLRHPCIAALYETMMHGPRLYVVMEAAGGGDLCTHVVAAKSRGLPEPRARSLATQLVSAVRHMHSRGVVHRDLKMENIMLDSTKQFIKIVDFGLSNVWSAGGALRTPCGSLEYAAPELFVDGRRYGPEVDLWSIGVIVYGMVTGGLPFAGGTAAAGAAGPAGSDGSAQLRAAISRGFTRKQHSALACVSTECKTFIQHLLEPKVELRMKIEEAARHRWVKKSGMRMKIHPFTTLDPKSNREIHREISELSGQSLIDVMANIKANPFGSTAGMYNIKTHLHQLQVNTVSDMLWSSNTQEPRPVTPPEYRPKYDDASSSRNSPIQNLTRYEPKPVKPISKISTIITPKQPNEKKHSTSDVSPRAIPRPLNYGLKKPVFKVLENGDCLDSRLPIIDEHSNLEDSKRIQRQRVITKDELWLNSCPVDVKRAEFYRRAGDGLPSWRNGVPSINNSSARILLQTNATTIKRASLGNIVSPHSSSNSHCKSEREMPVGWYTTKSLTKDTHIQRLRRTALMK